MLVISTLLYCTSYAACTSIVSGATSSERCKAPKGVIQWKSYPWTRKHLVLFRKQGLRVYTLNTRTLNFTRAAAFLDQELKKWNIQLAGLQEVRWLGSGKTIGDTTLLWSGREDNRHQEGVALSVHTKVMLNCVDSHQGTPAVCKVSAQCQSFISHCCLWPTKSADMTAKDQFLYTAWSGCCRLTVRRTIWWWSYVTSMLSLAQTD